MHSCLLSGECVFSLNNNNSNDKKNRKRILENCFSFFLLSSYLEIIDLSMLS